VDSQSNGKPTDQSIGGSPNVSPAEIEKLVRALATMMHDGTVSEMNVAFGAVSIHLTGGGGGRSQPHPDTAASSAAHDIEVAARAAEHIVTAPMIGTFYASPSPGELAFVEVGDRVEAGQVIGIIEAMKIMNEITADRDGTVAALLVDNGQAVEYGSPLIRLNLASAAG